ncbi:AGE family epimerase/isomerase [Brevundimonas diminuta]|uniref:AGE family epimerase/isomerase n=1 Tax=Brevundimonas diminuta TaxID=293 RepID=UPI003D06C358
MCGGSGTRLWPASRPSRPKQFIPLAGNRSLFQETAMRVAPLVGDGVMVVVAGTRHREWVIEQLEQLGLQDRTHILLEPEARDSAAAMAAAAAWTLMQDPGAVNVFVASDHHVPDHEAFREAVRNAASAAAQGRIVTLGVKPASPSTAYGYINPEGPGLAPVKAFREKPDRESAAEFIRDGYLWNSGNFIVSAATLVEELDARAPGVADAARRSLDDLPPGHVQVLGDAFRDAPKISIDYAVMEKTQRASVLAVDFAWSDLGAWDAIAETGEGEFGSHIFEDSEGCLVRAPEGVLVGVLGVSNLAIVAEDDAILVCDLNRAQDVKSVVERVRTAFPQHLDFRKAEPEALEAGGRRFADWLRQSALPLWSTLGQDEDGRFAEALSLDGHVMKVARRARVQARQIWSYAEAGRLGWGGPWRRAVRLGAECLQAEYLRPDGLCRTLLTADGAPLDDTAMLYDQAFVLLALQSARGLAPDVEAPALRIRESLQAARLPQGGWREEGEQPYQANAHMHLLEACLAWEEGGGDAGWGVMADEVVRMAHTRFIDAEGGFLREFFDEAWAPASSEDGRLVEPGHQFEWAWLLARHARLRDDAGLMVHARRLYEFGVKGVTDSRLALDAINVDGRPRGERARLWPQTEWMKAALILAESARDGERRRYLADAADAQRALWLYLTPNGAWRDKRLGRKGFINEAAPASSFYHIVGAFGQLQASARRLDMALADLGKPLA